MSFERSHVPTRDRAGDTRAERSAAPAKRDARERETHTPTDPERAARLGHRFEGLSESRPVAEPVQLSPAGNHAGAALSERGSGRRGNTPAGSHPVIQRSGGDKTDEENRLRRRRDEIRDWFKAQKAAGGWKEKRKQNDGNNDYNLQWKALRQEQEEVGAALVKYKENNPKYSGGELIEELEGGAVNKPQVVDYGLGDDHEMVFKKNLDDIGEAWGPYFAGIPIKDAHTARRAVATSKLDRMLGTGVVPKTSFAKHNGVSGAAMAKIPGMEVDKLSPPDKQLLYNEAAIKRGMYNAQTLDYLSGETDRHAKNLMIDFHHTVKLPDNEFAYGKHVKPYHDDVHVDFFKNTHMDSPGPTGTYEGAFHRKGVPKKVDHEVLGRLQSPFLEEDVRAKLAGYITPEENKARSKAIKYGRARLAEQTRVDDWDTVDPRDPEEADYFY